MSFLFSQPAPGILPANSVDFSEVETISANRILGNNLGVESTIQELQVSDVATMLNLAQYLTSVSGSLPISSSGGTTPTISISQAGVASNGYLSSIDWGTFNNKQPAGNYITALTGEVSATGPGSVAATITNNTVTNAKLAQIATQTFKGRTTAGTGNVEDLSATQATAILNSFVGDSGTGGTKGLVPAPAAGDAVAGKYLKADGSWATVSGLPSQTSNADKVLVTDGTSASWKYAGLGSGAFGTNNVILGRGKPGTITTANDNVIIGAYTTGSALSTGSYNTLIGNNIQNTSTGGGNAIVGNNISVSNGNIGLVAALGTGSVISASFQVAIGASINAEGLGAVCIGYTAGGGPSDVAIGYQASSNAANNVVVGKNSNAGSGGSTTILGSSSGKSTLSGANNTVVGYNSFNGASLTTAASNTIIGQGSGTALTTGSSNTILGQGSGTGLTTSSGNIFLGYASGLRSTTQSNELFIDNQDRTSYALQQSNSLIYGTFNATPSSQTLRTNSQFTATYGVSVSTAGYGLTVKSGSNAKIGTATFTAQNTVTVNTTAVTANSLIFVTGQDGTDAFAVGNKIAGTSFDIVHSSGNVTATVAWMIVEATP